MLSKLVFRALPRRFFSAGPVYFPVDPIAEIKIELPKFHACFLVLFDFM